MKKAIKIILISFFSICVVAIIAGYVVLTQIDFNQYKNVIIKTVKDSTGRDLTIGNIQVKVSFSPTIEVKDVAFSNALWAKNPVMVSAKTIDLGVAVLPLLHKSFVIDEFSLKTAVVNLEESADGRVNWDFQLPEAAVDHVSYKNKDFSIVKAAYAVENNTQSDVADLLSSIVIKQVALENVIINIMDKKSKVESYEIDYLNLDENDNDNIDFKFNVNKGLYSGQGTLGALKLFKSSTGYPVKADVSVMGIKAKTNVTLFDIFGDMRFDGSVVASQFLGKDSKFNETADVSFKGDLKNIEAVINRVDIAGNLIKGEVKADLANNVPVIQAVFNSDKIDISAFSRKTQSASMFSLISSAQATTLAPNEVIPYKVLTMVDANVDVLIAQIVNGNASLANDININAKVNSGKATISILKGVVAGGKVAANLIANAQNNSVTVRTDISKLNLMKLLNALKVSSETFNFISGSDMDLHINLAGNGQTYANVIDSLDGQVVAVVNKSELHLGNIGLLKGNIVSQLLDTLKLTKGNDDLSLSCAVIRSDVKDGKADFPDGVVVNADKFTLVANGDVNLKNDKISLSIKPFAGKLTETNIAKALSSLVKLTGTLQEPKIGIDGANAVKTIVGVTTGGPVYLGAQMLLENDGSPCYTALEGTGYETMFPKPENVVKSTAGDVGQILDDSVGAVKNTTKDLLNLLSGNKLEKNK